MEERGVEKSSPCKLLQQDLEEIFYFLTGDEAEDLCGCLESREYPAGTIIMREHEPAGYLAFLARGKVAVKKEKRLPGKHVLVAILERGALIGEMAVADRSTRNATVETLEPCLLYVLSIDDLDVILRERPGLGIKILRRILYVVSLRVRAADDRLSRLL